MMVEAAVIEQRKDGGVGNNIRKVIKKKRCKGKVLIRKPPPIEVVVPVTLRRLFVTCREVFKGPGTVPSASDVQKLCHILDLMMPEDVGLSRNLQFFKPTTTSVVEGNPRVTYTTIYKCENFSLCIFFIPANGVIPLHNHPEMTVFSKLLLGSMHIKAYDWVDPDNADTSKSSSKLRLARLKANKVFTAPCNTSVLYPTSGGNIHEFRAVTPCAVLDVMGPPYSKDDGRDCSYYRDTPYRDSSNGELAEPKEDRVSYGWLEEIEMPKDSQMDVIQYMGPQVTDINL